MMDKKPTPIDRIFQGYAGSAPDPKAPVPFTPRDDMERLRTLRRTHPQAFRLFGPERRIALGHYDHARAAAGYTSTSEEDDHGDNDTAA